MPPSYDEHECNFDAVELASRIVQDEQSQPKATPAVSTKRRLAISLAFVLLFFAGAALSAGASDTVIDVLTGSTDTDPCAEETATGETAAAAPVEVESGEPSAPAAAEDACEEPPGEAPDDTSADTPDESPAEGPAEAPPAQTEPVASAPPPSTAPPAAAPPHGHATPQPSRPGSSGGAVPGAALELETQDGSSATVWLHRTLPDPTPRAARVSPLFAHRLRLISAQAGVDWALVLAVLRAQGADRSVSVRAKVLRRLAAELASLGAEEKPWRAGGSVGEAGK